MAGNTELQSARREAAGQITRSQEAGENDVAVS